MSKGTSTLGNGWLLLVLDLFPFNSGLWECHDKDPLPNDSTLACVGLVPIKSPHCWRAGSKGVKMHCTLAVCHIFS